MESGVYEVVQLVTTVTQDYDRISIHGVRRVLLEHQAGGLGIPSEKMFIAKGASDADYESELLKALSRHRANGVVCVVRGHFSGRREKVP